MMVIRNVGERGRRIVWLAHFQTLGILLLPCAPHVSLLAPAILWLPFPYRRDVVTLSFPCPCAFFERSRTSQPSGEERTESGDWDAKKKERRKVKRSSENTSLTLPYVDGVSVSLLTPFSPNSLVHEIAPVNL